MSWNDKLSLIIPSNPSNNKKDSSNSKESHLEGVYLYVSFDLVDSSRYKSIEGEWPFLINDFYQGAVELMNKSVDEGFKVWKLIGDEILFYRKITSLESLKIFPPKVYEAMQTLKQNLYEKHISSRGIIYIKSTMFIANVEELRKDKNKTSKITNFIVNTQENSYDDTNYAIKDFDFLGPDIDLGFRLSSNSFKNQLCVSGEIVYLLKEKLNKNEKKKYKIVKFADLKGIWNGRKYPIIWYRDRWDENSIFEYDDNSEIVKDIYANFKGFESTSSPIKKFIKKFNQNLEGSSSAFDRITSIIQQSGKEITVEGIKKAIELENDFSTTPALSSNQVPEARITEVHYVLIGVDQEDQIVLFKKNKRGKSDEYVYDFGCAYSNGYESLSNILNRYYGDIYENYTVAEQEDNLPQPVSAYVYEKEGKAVNGFIFVSRIDSVYTYPSRYKDYILIGLDKFYEMDDSVLQKSAKHNVKKAISILKNFESLS